MCASVDIFLKHDAVCDKINICKQGAQLARKDSGIGDLDCNCWLVVFAASAVIDVARISNAVVLANQLFNLLLNRLARAEERRIVFQCSFVALASINCSGALVLERGFLLCDLNNSYHYVSPCCPTYIKYTHIRQP